MSDNRNCAGIRTALIYSMTTLFLLALPYTGFAEQQNVVASEDRRASQPEALKDLNHPDGPLEVNRTALLEKLVRGAYDRLSQLVGRSGEEVDFALSDFRTFYPDRFSEARWFDLVDMPEGWVLDISRKRERRIDHGEVTSERVWYEARWNRKPDFEIPVEQKGLTLEDVLQSAEKDDFFEGRPHLALTTYKVTVSYQGRQRTYRAAFHFFGGDDETPITVSDLITQAVDTALAEPMSPPLGSKSTSADADGDTEPEQRAMPPGGHPAASGQSVDPWVSNAGVSSPFAKVTGAVSMSLCEASSSADTLQRNNVGRQDHLQGHHIAAGKFRIACTCASDCEATCESNISSEQCIDEGLCFNCYVDPLTTCHKASQPSTDQEVVEAPGSATCGGIVGCAFKQCKIGCICNASVSVNMSKGSGSINSFSGSWSQKQTRTKTCACQEIQDPCSSSLSVAGQSAGFNLVTGQAFLPCDDGGGVGGETDPTGGADGGSNTGTPILIDLGGGKFQLSDLSDGVQFDLNADGHAESISWTARGSDDAFLVLDRNGNGVIDDGLELFGDAADQPSGGIRHGYNALAVFDQAASGGDEDGQITPADSVFGDLRLWIDTDQDGRSGPDELSPLSAWNIMALDLDFVESRRKDRHGNEFRYSSKAQVGVSRGKPHVQMVDVIFLQE